MRTPNPAIPNPHPPTSHSRSRSRSKLRVSIYKASIQSINLDLTGPRKIHTRVQKFPERENTMPVRFSRPAISHTHTHETTLLTLLHSGFYLETKRNTTADRSKYHKKREGEGRGRLFPGALPRGGGGGGGEEGVSH
jgi:hypothetical protein